MAKRYRVHLDAEERTPLSALVRVGKAAAYKRLHARALLKADQGERGPTWTDAQIAQALEVAVRTVARVRQRFVEDGLDTALGRTPQAQPSRHRRLDGRAEATLVALCCSAPPAGKTRWTLRLLADRLVALDIVEDLSHDTVRQTLKKTP